MTCDPDIGVMITNRTADVVNNKAANDRLIKGELIEDNSAKKFFTEQNPYEVWAESSENITQSAQTDLDWSYESYIKEVAEGYADGTYSSVDEAIDKLKEYSYSVFGIPAE